MELQHDFEALFDGNESNGAATSATSAPLSVPNAANNEAKSSQNSGVPMEISDVDNVEDFTLEPENPKEEKINGQIENSPLATTTMDKVLADIKGSYNKIREFSSSFDPELFSRLNELTVSTSPTTNALKSMQLSFLVKLKVAFDEVNEILSEVDNIREQLGIAKSPQVALPSPNRTEPRKQKTLSPNDYEFGSKSEFGRNMKKNEEKKIGKKNEEKKMKKKNEDGDESEVLNHSREIFGGSPEKSPDGKAPPPQEKKSLFQQDRLFVENSNSNRKKSLSRNGTDSVTPRGKNSSSSRNGTDSVTPRGKNLSSSRTKELYRAVKNDEFEVVKKLLEAREDPNVPYSADKQAPFPLHGAARADNQQIVQLLLDHGAEINKVNMDKGASALHLASAAGFSEIVEILLKNGASKNLQNSEGHTALDVATQKEVREILSGWEENDLKPIATKKANQDPFSTVATNSTYGKPRPPSTATKPRPSTNETKPRPPNSATNPRTPTTATKSRPSSSNEKSDDEDLFAKKETEPSSKVSNSSQKKTLGGKISRSGQFSQPRRKKASDGPFLSEKLPSTVKAKKSVVMEREDQDKPPSPFDFDESNEVSKEKIDRAGGKSKLPPVSTPKKSLGRGHKGVFSPGESDFDEVESVKSSVKKDTKKNSVKKSGKVLKMAEEEEDEKMDTIPDSSDKGKGRGRSAKRDRASSEEEISKTKRKKSDFEEEKKPEKEEKIVKIDKKKSKEETISGKKEAVKSPKGKKKNSTIDVSEKEEEKSTVKKRPISKSPVKNSRVKKSGVAEKKKIVDQEIEEKLPKKTKIAAKPNSESDFDADFEEKIQSKFASENKNNNKISSKEEEIPEIFVALSSTVPAEVKTKFLKIAESKKWKHCSDWEEGVTHLAAASVDGKPNLCKRTVKLLNAMLERAFIIKTEWLTACVNAKKIVPEKDYLFSGTIANGEKGGPARAVKSFQNQEPRLFEGLNVFLKGDFKKAIKKEEFEQMVTVGGGKILKSEPTKRSLAKSSPAKKPFHASTGSQISKCSYFVVTETPITSQDLINVGVANVPTSWILDSIELYQLQEITFPKTLEENSD